MIATISINRLRGLDKTEATKAEKKIKKIIEWCDVNNWRQDPQFRPQFFGVDQYGIRLRLRFGLRSLELQKRVAIVNEIALSPEEAYAANATTTATWEPVDKSSYEKIKVGKKLDFGKNKVKI